MQAIIGKTSLVLTLHILDTCLHKYTEEKNDAQAKSGFCLSHTNAFLTTLYKSNLPANISETLVQGESLS